MEGFEVRSLVGRKRRLGTPLILGILLVMRAAYVRCSVGTLERCAVFMPSDHAFIRQGMLLFQPGQGSYIESPYTPETLSFFERAGCPLKTITVGAQKHILTEQPGIMTLRLYNTGIRTIPGQLVSGMIFLNLTIIISALKISKLPPQFVAYMFLTAIKVLVAKELLIFWCEDEDPVLITLETEHAKIFVETLVLEGMNNASIGWILDHNDFSKCDLNLRIQHSSRVKSLMFIDRLKCRTLQSLGLRGLPNLKVLACRALENGCVLNDLSLYLYSEELVLPERVLLGIAGKSWSRLCVPKTVWDRLCNVTTNRFNIRTLSVQFNHYRHFENIQWFRPNNNARARPYVQNLNVILPLESTIENVEQIQNLLAWASDVFEGVLIIEIYGSVRGGGIFKDLVRSCFYIYAFPDLLSLMIGYIPCRLHYFNCPTSSIICVASEIYPDWVDGKINGMWDKYSVDRAKRLTQNRPTAFLRQENLPTRARGCPSCKSPFGTLSKTPTGSPVYICMVGLRENLMCNLCLARLLGYQELIHESAMCNMCDVFIRPTITKYLVEKTANGTYSLQVDKNNKAGMLMPFEDPEISRLSPQTSSNYGTTNSLEVPLQSTPNIAELQVLDALAWYNKHNDQKQRLMFETIYVPEANQKPELPTSSPTTLAGLQEVVEYYNRVTNCKYILLPITNSEFKHNPKNLLWYNPLQRSKDRHVPGPSSG
ncbi:hypothetical protein NEDG_02145 [Nematocida displodere]|uniref:Uncharacterized protein n=1 Tax=Nematocida displodere TaxID=1805483 RepID=A0A177EGZ8_9MICR|nr:hypothetical protein NEDG_02145 [Nematocida displodere]